MTIATGKVVLIGQPLPASARIVPGERLDEVFERGCDVVRARQGPGTLAVDAEHERVTFDELDRRANQLARFLLRQGARAGDRIALLFDDPVVCYASMLAVLKINAAYVPLDVGFPVDRISYILSDAGVSMVLTTAASRGKAPGLSDAVGHMGALLVCIRSGPSVDRRAGLEPVGRGGAGRASR